MLELGNKKNGRVSYKMWFEHLGLQHISVDINGEDGALPIDLRHPLKSALVARGLPAQYDMVTNIGTTEHVVDSQDRLWSNILDVLIAPRGVLVSITPLPGDWYWHGLHYPTVEFYTELVRANGLQLLDSGVYGSEPTRCLYFVARKLEDREAYSCPVEHLYQNKIRRRQK